MWGHNALWQWSRRPSELDPLEICGEAMDWGDIQTLYRPALMKQRTSFLMWCSPMQNVYQVQRALQKNGQVLNGRLMVGVKRLEERHKPVIDSLDWASSDASVRSTVKPVTVRPYKLDNPAIQVSMHPHKAAKSGAVVTNIYGCIA